MEKVRPDPDGYPTVMVTGPLKPRTELILIVVLWDPPCAAEPEVGLTLMPKSGASPTVTV